MPLICFASPKGGVGKTTLAANVASELARGGLRVIALDLDPQNALRLHFGVRLEDTTGFTHLLTQRPDWHRYLVETTTGVSLLPYGSSGMDDAIILAAAVAESPELIQRPVDNILASPDVCLVVDTAPGPSSLLAAVLPKTRLLLTILLVDGSSTSLIPAIESGSSYGLGHVVAGSDLTMSFILNQFDPRTRLDGAIVDAATRHLGERLLGVIYRDGSVAEAAAAQKVLANYAPASKAGYDIAAITREIRARLRLPLPVPDDQRSRA